MRGQERAECSCIVALMKNQYFGDRHDFLKYVMLRCFLRAGLRTTVGWMLTPDDGSSDGEKRRYLDQPPFEVIDPELMQFMRAWRDSGAARGVEAMEQSGLVRATFFREMLRDDTASRREYFDKLESVASGSQLVFLDPDNGFEVKSRRSGKKDSSKHLYWNEVASLYDRGHSVVVYQHLARITVPTFVQRKLQELFAAVAVARVMILLDRPVMYFVIPRPAHVDRIRAAMADMQKRKSWGLGFAEYDAAGVVEHREELARRGVPRQAERRPGFSTIPGFVNRNHQEVLRKTDRPGTDHNQVVYEVRCLVCGHDYGANGSDLHLRRCPECQQGKSGLHVM